MSASLARNILMNAPGVATLCCNPESQIHNHKSRGGTEADEKP